MIGYHYTTRAAYERIRTLGLCLSPLEERHRDGCQPVLHLVENGCIWVYPEFMRGQKLAGMAMYVACRHESERIVCLEVTYPEIYSATRMASVALARQFEDDTHVVLRHSLDFSVIAKAPTTMFGHIGQQFDLITEPVHPRDIRLVGEWDLMKFAESDIVETAEKMVA